MALLRIAHKLKADLPRFRTACSQWRYTLPLNDVRNLDFPIGPPPLDPNTILFLPETHFHLHCPSKSAQPGSLAGKWIARTSPLWFTECSLFNPLNIHEYFYTDPPVEAFINLSDTHVLELSRTFFLLETTETKAEPISKKVVGGWNIDSDYVFGVLALLEGERGGGLWLWRLRDDEWIEIEGTSLNDDHRIVDIVYHDQKFYAFELWTWRIGVIDPESESVTMEFIAAPKILTDPNGEYYTLNLDGGLYHLWGSGVNFVSSNGQLYLVVEVFPKSEGDDDRDGGKSEVKSTIIVFVMKQQSGVWERVKNIGDQIFFVGYDTCFALPSSSVNLPQWKPSSICLFTRPFPLLYDGFRASLGASQRIPKGLEYLKVFHYATYWRYYRLFEMGEDEEEKGVVPFEKLPMDVYTGLFFPPPAWVQWRCPDLDNAEISFENVKFSDADRW